MHRLARPFVLGLVALVLVACGATTPGGPTEEPSGSTMAIDSPEAAARLVIGGEPRFEGIGPFDPELIGGCCWYEATAVEGGYQVIVNVGWGDCPAGCTNKHRWTYAVTPSGEMQLIGESGDPVPAGVFPPSGDTTN
jgi:hypothetical protein